MVEFLQSILGTYTPVTYEAIAVDASGSEFAYDVIPAGLAGVDWLYVISGLLFVVVVYSVLRLLGGLICRNF